MRIAIPMLAACAIAAGSAYAQTMPVAKGAPAGQKGGTAPRKGATQAAQTDAAVKKAQAPAAQPAPDPAKMDELLRRWEAQSRTTTSLNARFERTDHSAVWQTNTRYSGQALLQSPNLACLNFEKVVEKGAKPDFHERIICDGSKVFQIVNESKQVFVYPLGEDERQKALEEGPLPFLFNMRAADAKRRYVMALVAEDEKADAYIIEIRPRQEIDREAFGRAIIQLNRRTFLPDKLWLLDPKNAKDYKLFKFTNIERNAKIKPDTFDGETLARRLVATKDAKGKPVWDRVDNPGDESGSKPATTARPRTGAVPKTAGAATARPAQREPRR